MVVPAFPDWPNPESPLLAGIVRSIRARSKAFKGLVHEFEISVEAKSETGEPYERLNLEFRNWSDCPDRLTFAFWDDGTFWLDSRRPSKNGWAYEYSFYGDVNSIDPDIVRDMIERSPWITSSDEMQVVWSRCKPYTG